MADNTAFPLPQTIHRQPLVLSGDTVLPRVLSTMAQQGSSYVLVTDPQCHPIGLFTERDLVALTVTEKPLATLTLAQVMQTNPVVLAEAQLTDQLTDIMAVLTYMGQRRVRHLPIVSPQGTLTGIITHHSIRQLLQPVDLLRLGRVEEVMVQQVRCISPTLLGLEAVQKLHHYQISCLVVTVDGEPNSSPIGVITERDILRLQAQVRPGHLAGITGSTVAEIMQSPVLHTQPSTSLWQAHQQMQAHGVRRLVVVNEHDQLVGLVTSTRLLQGVNLSEVEITLDVLQQIVADRTLDLRQANLTLKKKVEERKRSKAALQYQIARERLVNRIAQRIRQSLVLETILSTTVTEVRQFLKAERAFIYQFQPGQSGTVGHIAVECTNASCSPLQGNPQLAAVLNQIEPEFYQTGRLHSIPDLQAMKLSSPELTLFRQLPIRSLVVAPIATKETLWGLLILNQCSGPRRWEKLEIDLLKQLATQVGIAIQQAELYAQLEVANARLEELAHVDGLTQVANRRRFEAHLQQEWRRLRREQAPLSLILCDIDHFKRYNDTYGHPAGDICLQQVAQGLAQAIRRPADLVARYGGEEFVLVLPATDRRGAETIRLYRL